ncbi:hypothetical protein Tco_0446473 [Tanacetum coccineum]
MHQKPEDTRGRGGKIQKQKRNTTEEEGSSSQVNGQNGVYWKKFNIWYRKLKYWRHNLVPHCIDFMHVEKNVAEIQDNGKVLGFKIKINESDVKPSWKDIEKAKACMLAKAQASEASSKAKVEACGSKAKLQASTKTLIVKSPVPITNCVLGLANRKPTGRLIKSKTLDVKIQDYLLTLLKRKEAEEELRKWIVC